MTDEIELLKAEIEELKTQLRNLSNKNPDAKPLSYWLELMKTDKDLYLQMKTQDRLNQDAQALGADFFDVDEKPRGRANKGPTWLN
jgi:hypothetical protein